VSSRCLVFVHAHPDDETLSTGGTIARYADEGSHVCLITCTNGEVGEVAEVPELGEVADIQSRLGEVRRAELVEACRRLGRVDLRMLGFHDSGMEDTPANDDPGAFINQDIDQAVGKIVAIIREIRPQILLTYNEIGFYGHPDHIRAHEAAVRAVEAAADPGYAPGSGEAFAVSKVYFTGIPKSLLRQGREMAREMWGEDGEDFFSLEEIERIGTEDERITTRIDVAPFVRRKFDALEAHRTQRGTTERFFQIPEDIRGLWMGTEHYVLVDSKVPRPEGVEVDLFEGIPG
jgi:N-acetyl-1-D-myo-inositol-2-amino-2-deoxy-alpha-D-glucopyranoside deacetylase